VTLAFTGQALLKGNASIVLRSTCTVLGNSDCIMWRMKYQGIFGASSLEGFSFGYAFC
jgi:hypothetical protein